MHWILNIASDYIICNRYWFHTNTIFCRYKKIVYIAVSVSYFMVFASLYRFVMSANHTQMSAFRKSCKAETCLKNVNIYGDVMFKPNTGNFMNTACLKSAA